VAMGMTSEEPITHLEWFIGLLEQAGLAPDRHCLVMALPDSYLDRFAQERGLPSRPLQVDEGTGTGGRMSAPTTRVFLLPAAFALRATGSGLADVLRAAWAEHALSSAVEAPAENPYVTLAAAMSDASIDGVCRLFVDARGGWEALLPWIEQLMEESLGKGGKGLLVFGPDRRNPDGRFFQADPSIQVQLGPGLARSGRTNRGGGLDNQMFISTPISGTATPGGPPFVGNDPSVFPPERPSSRLHPADTLLSALATAFLGWQLTMALYGYLQDIQFAGQPAVEDYKTRARRLRELDHPLREGTESASAVRSGRLIMLQPPGDEGGGETPSEMIATRIASTCPSYLDITINGECPLDLVERMRDEVQQLGERVLGVPVKVRRAPAAYHSTEQSEMDGPTGVFSIRLLTTHSEVPVLGEYEMGFLTAQAVATWQAMTEVGRDCYLLVWEGTARQAAVPAPSLLSEVSRLLL
jgi:hypothetical protein